ncbi:hypothetical protein UFOVP998_5 [uncultured Caudovirales phage]|uniref:Uncharacterized protein n=1 Tax=uncultured Caudovirales phage TaxID=2100421 RepID=A0A6J5RZY2_9CAUD|nr:hypothetical protein UFOVP998_5 [uncultured Caudovirales phage]CAB4199511.1 hypothetical protein UFOVP1331_54 [uncultured Caudovirales phage]CAB4212721.1 hypothetical protein UFOVP1442_21 [uncultured Caudovirales phage]CAB5228041.1 hypothetical protein UFOVP1535_30 [uncultured Caudovirales phage]
MSDVDLPPDNFTLNILEWLQFEIYPGLLQEPWTARAEAVWVAGDRGFIGLWATGYARELAPPERLEACRQELYRRIYAVKFPATPPSPPPPKPPLPGPIGHRRVVGQLRRQGQVFSDDAGLILPMFWHFGEAFSAFVRRPDEVRAELDDIEATGYHGIRFWDVLGYYDQNRPGDPNTWSAWAGKEVTPVAFTAFSGRRIAATADYYAQLEGFLRECRNRGLVVHHSRGDMNAWSWEQITQHAARVGDVQRAVGVQTIAINEACNEAWQNGVPEPVRLKTIIERINNRAALSGSSAADDNYGGELPESVERFTKAIGMDVHVVHGYRGGESMNRIGHIHALGYETLPAAGVPGWQGEPAGPGDGVSVGREEHPEALCLMGAMALCTRQAYVGMSGHGVFWRGPMAAMTAYRELARVPALLPADIMTWPHIIHGGNTFARRGRVFVAHPGGDAPGPVYRADHILHDDGRFVALIYGGPGTYRVPVEQSFEGEIITPHTSERHPFSGQAGQLLDIAFERGRLVVGRVR